MNKIKGIKQNMSQVFLENGMLVPVTILLTQDELLQEYADKPIEIVGTSKGKGFTGVMKRWNFRGSMATRGQSNTPRSGGSIGSQTPGRVRKGKKMAGHKGNHRVTVKGSKIVKIDNEAHKFYVLGPVPGARNSKVEIIIL